MSLDKKHFVKDVASLQAETHARIPAQQDNEILEDENATRIWATKSRSKLWELHLDEDFTFAILDKAESRQIKHGLHLLKQVRIFEQGKDGKPMIGGFGDVLEHNLRTVAIISRAKDGRTQESLLNRTNTSKYQYDLQEKKKTLWGIPGGKE